MLNTSDRIVCTPGREGTSPKSGKYKEGTSRRNFPRTGELAWKCGSYRGLAEAPIRTKKGNPANPHEY
jgi:hypothetical protein